VLDGFGLVKERVFGAGAGGQGAGKGGEQGKGAPLQPGTEGAVCLVEGFLGQEERPVEFGFKCLAECPVAVAELGLEMVAVLLNDVVEGDDWVQAHITLGRN